MIDLDCEPSNTGNRQVHDASDDDFEGEPQTKRRKESTCICPSSNPD